MGDFQERPRFLQGKSLMISKDRQIYNTSQLEFLNNADFSRRLGIQVIKGLLYQTSRANRIGINKNIYKIKRKKKDNQNKM